ncbi:ras GEF [Daedalea quercina L-15889]|uniref:Ras GEF n=1 Tax=Daedalea quercina L-15889 TaxID=1314783 RepID=A0A165T5G5_9APHY|nr:ras GEF [Daedalea quercina L-15889]
MSAVAHTHSVRRGGALPRLWIDSSLSGCRKQLCTPASSLPSANVLSGDTSTTLTDSPSIFTADTFHVLALYDYEAVDSDQLSFKKNEVLEIVKREESGWWAALRPGDNLVGWIPRAFVEPISERVVQQLRIKDDARIVSPASGLSSRSGTFLGTPESEGAGLQWMPLMEGDQAPVRLFAGTDAKGVPSPFSPLVPPHEGVDDVHSESDVDVSPADDAANSHSNVGVPVEVPDEPPPVPSKDGIHLALNLKPTLSLQGQRHSTPLRASPAVVDVPDHARSHSDPTSPMVNRQWRRRPVLIDDRPSLSRLNTLFESESPVDVDIIVSSPFTSSPLAGIPFVACADSSETVVPGCRAGTAKQSFPRSPLNPKAISPACQGTKDAKTRSSPSRLRLLEDTDELLLAEDGSVIAGTLPALIERLTFDTYDPVQMRNFQRAFFMTYKSFAAADEVFTLLEDLFHTERPPADAGQDARDLDQWREQKLEPMQRRVLFILKMWFEEYGMLRDEPHIVGRLLEFLSSLTSPFVAMARSMLDSLQRHLATKAFPTPPTPGAARRKVNKRKASKNDVVRLEPMAIARQLCLHEHRLYAKLELRECMHWMTPSAADGIPNLTALCMARARLTGWVRTSLLGVDGLSRRAEMLEFWIRVAEGCKELCNFSSLSAITAGLSDPAIARSQLLWAHLPRGTHQEATALLSELAGDRLPYCAQQEAVVGGPCVPYVEPYLALVAHVSEHFPDTVPSPETERPLIHFAKREKWHGAVQEMLRHQAHAYDFAEDQQAAEFVEANVASTALDQNLGMLPHQSEVDIANLKKVLESLP